MEPLFDDHANFATSTVLLAPTPAISGGSLRVAVGDGDLLFTAIPPYNCTVKNPTGEKEIVRVTGRSSDIFTITRAREGTTAIEIAVGAKFTNTITVKTLKDIEEATGVAAQVLDGFGVNYDSNTPAWQMDILALKAHGIKTVRTAIPSFSVQSLAAWTAANAANENTTGTLPWYRKRARTFAQAGFYVTSGPGAGPLPISTSNWPDFHDAVVAEAAQQQAIGVPIGDFALGNELEYHVDGTTVTQNSLRDLLKQLATDVKAVYNLSPISYHTDLWLGWVADGTLGSIDLLGMHPYGSSTNLNASAQTADPHRDGGGFDGVPPAVAVFGNKCYVSEFNLTPGGYAGLDLSIATQILNGWVKQYFVGLDKFIFYKWSTHNNNSAGEDNFVLRKRDGTMSYVFNAFLKSYRY